MRALHVICSRRGFFGATLVAGGAAWTLRRVGRPRLHDAAPAASPGARRAWRHRRLREVVLAPGALGPSGPGLAG